MSKHILVRKTSSVIGGEVKIPGSKSHTIRALFIATLATGLSTLRSPLYSADAESALRACRLFGAEISEGKSGELFVQGLSGLLQTPENVIDVGNSGTTLRIALLSATLIDGCTVFTGDEQIRRRLLGGLIQSANDLGAQVWSTRKNGMAPVVVKGRAVGGHTSIDAVTSQYLTSLLINAPLMDNDTTIEVTRLNERPYVEMTLWWLDKMGIQYSHQDLMHFEIAGRQHYPAFDMKIPGDFSSATFFMVLAAISGGKISFLNLDMSDPQGDKEVFNMLQKMGAGVSTGKSVNGDDCMVVEGGDLQGVEIDMNSTPDALPALAVAGCFAAGETRLVNVMQARYKETDRIRVMCQELTKMGADIEELPDGLVIRPSRLKGCLVDGHGDHRVVMALSLAGAMAEGETCITTAEAVDVTFPDFVVSMKNVGVEIDYVKS